MSLYAIHALSDKYYNTRRKVRAMSNEKILVIDNNELNMKLAKDLLKMGEYKVLEAADAESGIEKAQAHHPALILMDIQLPGMNGLDAATLLKKDADFDKTPIVALTGCAMKGDRQMALDAGCVGYITKPIDTRIFLKQIAQFLNGDYR